MSKIQTFSESLKAAAVALSGTIDSIERSDFKEGDHEAALTNALENFHALASAYAAIDTQRKRIYHIVDKMERSVLPTMFDESGQDMVRIPTIGRSFYPLTKYSAKTVDKVKLFEWLREQGANDVIAETVNASTLTSFLKEYETTHGISVPEDAAVLSTYKMIGSSAYTPK